VKLVDEDSHGYLSARRTKLRRDVCCNIIVTDDMMELETIEFALKLADF
jgi:Tfp pilus assembly pilus retraction ATPase PilT